MCHTTYSTTGGEEKMFFKILSLKLRQVSSGGLCFPGFSLESRSVWLKVGFVLLDLDHEVVQVDELGTDGQAAERGLVQDLVKAVVVLDELSQGALQDKG